jgi:hypothetical protein
MENPMKQKLFSFQIPTVFLNKIRRIAKRDNISVAHYIRTAIKQYIDNDKNE